MIEIRIFNELGIKFFTEYIESLKAEKKIELPIHILQSPIHTEEFDANIKLDPTIKFESRYEMMSYLCRQLVNIDIEKHKSTVGFWNWLSLFWFDQICPSDGEIFNPRDKSYYIYSLDYRRRTRHLIYSSWLLVSRHKELAKIFLYKLKSRGDLQEQIMGRQELWSSEAVIRLVNNLYFNENDSTIKRGAAGKGEGSVRRLVDILQQLECNYDLSSMTQKEMLDLLPVEFDRFADSANIVKSKTTSRLLKLK